MDVMLVGIDEGLQQRLAETIPLARTDRIFHASGMLSAIWYAKTLQPGLIVIDLYPPDCCCQRLVELLTPFCPDARVLISDRSGELLPAPRDGMPTMRRPPASSGGMDMAAT